MGSAHRLPIYLQAKPSVRFPNATPARPCFRRGAGLLSCPEPGESLVIGDRFNG